MYFFIFFHTKKGDNFCLLKEQSENIRKPSEAILNKQISNKNSSMRNKESPKTMPLTKTKRSEIFLEVKKSQINLNIPIKSGGYNMSDNWLHDSKIKKIKKEENIALIELLNIYFFIGFLVFIVALNLSCLFILPFYVKTTIQIDKF